MSFPVGLVGLHIVVALIVVFIFWMRVRNRPLFSRAMFSRRDAATPSSSQGA
jgi:lipopolysaccharide export system permease protein